MRSQLSRAFVGLFCFVSAAACAEQPRDACATACIDIFGGVMPIPPGYKLQPDFGDLLRLIRLDRDQTKPYGNIYIGKVASLASKEEREKSARDLGASLERESRGKLNIEVTTRITKQLLVDEPVPRVCAHVRQPPLHAHH